MNLIRYQPSNLLYNLQDELNHIFGLEKKEKPYSAWDPHVDLQSYDDKYVAIADLPGVEIKDLHVNIENNKLTISGERKTEKNEGDASYTRTERFTGKFWRQFSLDNMSSDNIGAKYDEGVLTVTIRPRTGIHV